MQLVRATRTDSSPPVPSSRGENSSFCLRRLSRKHHYLLSLVAYSPPRSWTLRMISTYSIKVHTKKSSQVSHCL
jgi:hypothetical protein